MMTTGVRFAVILLCIFCLQTLQAQRISVGVKGGISIPNLSAPGGDQSPVSTGYTSRLGPDAALFAQFHLSHSFSIQPSLEYSSQGGKKSGIQAFPTPAEAAPYFDAQNLPTPTYLYGNFKVDFRLSYLILPVLAKYEIAFGKSPFHIYADAGPFAALLLSAKDVTSGSSYIYLDEQGTQPLPGLPSFSFDSDSTVTNSLKKFNTGIEGHLGFSYTLAKRHTIFVEGGGGYGFIPIQKDEAYGKNNIGAVIVTAGYSFRF